MTKQETKAGARTQLETAARNLRKGDVVTNWEGEIRHRYAGLIANYPSLKAGDEALAGAGFVRGYASAYLPSSSWEVA